MKKVIKYCVFFEVKDVLQRDLNMRRDIQLLRVNRIYTGSFKSNTAGFLKSVHTANCVQKYIDRQ